MTMIFKIFIKKSVAPQTFCLCWKGVTEEGQNGAHIIRYHERNIGADGKFIVRMVL